MLILPQTFAASSKGRYVVIAVLLFMLSLKGSAAIKTWTGSAGDSHWSSPANWNDNTLPKENDLVVFDNINLAGNYTVTISGTDSIVVQSVKIQPLAGNLITLAIDSLSTQQIALTLLGAGYSMIIGSGAVFINASGASGGNVITLADSLQISNGGQYTHRTRRPHTAIVAMLSHKPGTENGSFEFDLPSGTGTVSLSNRIYGNLILSATKAGGSRSYTGTGSNTLTIRGDLILHTGVNLNIDLATANGNIIVNGNFIQEGGSLNLASGAGDMTVMKIGGHVTQSASAQITESNTGIPCIELNGLSQQQISFAGSLTNEVIVRINNPSGIVLQSPLSLPYRLDLLQGAVTTTSNQLLVLDAGCDIRADTVASKSYVNGPMRKEGLSATDHFLFPVGKALSMRWLELKNATGNFTVEYIKGNPKDINSAYGTGIDHIASGYYWTVDADPGLPSSASMELSFAAGNSGVTDMSELRIAELMSGSWMDRNNESYTGSPGSSGSVNSEIINNFGPSSRYFTLASSTANQNPLPVKLVSFVASRSDPGVNLYWEIGTAEDSLSFEIWASQDNQSFRLINKILSVPFQTAYRYTDGLPYPKTSYYKLCITEKSGTSYFSKVVALVRDEDGPAIQFVSYSVVKNNLEIGLVGHAPGIFKLKIVNSSGKIIKVIGAFISDGFNKESIRLDGVSAGVYYIMGQFENKCTNVLRFIKQ